MFKLSILYTVFVIVLVIGGGCDQNEGVPETRFVVSDDGTRYISTEDERCQNTLKMLDKTGFKASDIFTAKAGSFENTIDECLEWIFTGSFVD